MSAAVGLVVIGRNEGARLERALRSGLDAGLPVVYADSASTDGSAERAEALGAIVARLDPSRPFGAARGRHEGFARLLEAHPALEAVQFLDGDCELEPGWLETGLAALRADPRLGGVWGTRVEREPGSTIFHEQLELEWRIPAGPATWFCGDALIRAAAYRESGGFDPALVSGEESDLCVRLRAKGWSLLKLDAPMSRHEAGEFGFSQWWRRAQRTGTSYAVATAKHGGLRASYRARKIVRIAVWAGLVPALALGGAPFTKGASLLLLVAYPALAWRARREGRGQGLSGRALTVYALFTVLNRFPQLLGVLAVWLGVDRRRAGAYLYKER
ncbi:MAG: glycosyltransferase family A protein [Elusimicrobiota bacterium]|nr:glycosyltransferase family A protein [Elusimicrobiota bacterium]